VIDRIFAWAPLAVGLAFLGMLIAAQPDRILRGHNDFIQLYAGAQLAGTPDLYSREANLKLIQQTHGFTMETVVYTRPPFYAVVLKPLAWLPYQAAYAIYSLASLCAILWFVWRFQKECPALPVLAAMSFPVFVTLCTGQDAAFLLASLGASILLMRKRRDFAGGLVLCVLAIKFHLFVFLPLALLLRKRWQVLAGSAAGSLGLLVIGGWQPLLDYYKVLRDPWIHYSAEHMPNLHGVSSILGGGWLLEGALIAALLVGFVWISNSTDSFELVLALSLVGGLLVSYHSGIADDIVLYPALVLILSATSDHKIRALAALMLTPIPFVMVMVGPPYTLALPIMLMMLVVLAGWRRLPIPAPSRAII
jgi:hypothetical protein